MENAGSWNSGLEKEQLLETYSAQLQKSWNSMKVIFGNKKIVSEKNTIGGPHPGHEGGGVPYPLGAPRCLVGPLVALQFPSSAIWSLSSEKKS